MTAYQKMAVLLAAALLLFTGCAVEPSEADIKKVYETQLSQIKATRGDLTPKLHGLRKLGCTKAESSPGYNCDVELALETIMN